MKHLLSTLALLACVLVAWHLGMRDSIAAGHLIDWIMGGLCLAWLLVILKVPWDLFFEANAVLFELQRSAERNLAVPAGREGYVRKLRLWLGVAAVGSHLLSAAFIAAVAWFSGGAVGYYFAVFYLVATVFRPAVAGYRYLSDKLRSIGEETRYPREDVVTLRARVETQERKGDDLDEKVRILREGLAAEQRERDRDVRELRQNVHAITREFETTMSRLTDNQEVIKGIQAFVRLIAHSQ